MASCGSKITAAMAAFVFLLALVLLSPPCNAAKAPCPTYPAPKPKCINPQACANQCAAAGYLIGYCELLGTGVGDCVCVKCPDAAHPQLQKSHFQWSKPSRA